jgi:hypothetical protein
LALRNPLKRGLAAIRAFLFLADALFVLLFEMLEAGVYDVETLVDALEFGVEVGGEEAEHDGVEENGNADDEAKLSVGHRSWILPF